MIHNKKVHESKTHPPEQDLPGTARTREHETEAELRRLNEGLALKARQLEQSNLTLMESEQRLHLAIATGQIGLWVWNLTGPRKNFKEWSPRLKEIFGLAPEADVTHEAFLSWVHPEDRDRVDTAIDAAMRGVDGGDYHCEYRIIHQQDGGERWVTARGHIFFDGAQQPIRSIGTVMDITERRRAEEISSRQQHELENRIAERTADLARMNEHLRASEILARGQMESLTQTLTALSRESEPEKFLEHVLLALGERFDAHSIGVWEFNSAAGRMDMLANCKDGQLYSFNATEQAHAFHVTIQMQDHAIWKEFFRTGAFCVMGEFEPERNRIRILDGTESPWQDWTPDPIHDATVVELIERLKTEGVASTLWVPMLTGGMMTGFLSIRSTQRRLIVCQEIELTRALAHQAMLAIRLMRLSQSSRRAAVEAERDRLARDIHDTLAQGFTGVIMQLEAAQGATDRGERFDASEHINRAKDLARSSLEEARRSVRALRPRSLREGNLCAALEALLQRMTAGTPLRAALHVHGEDRNIPADWEEALLRIAQESLTNALKHAQASEFTVTLNFLPTEIQLLLSDNGRGFDPAIEYDGFGLIGMRERVGQLGGHYQLHSEPGRGTKITVTRDRFPMVDAQNS